MESTVTVTSSELLATVAARELAGKRTVFAGIGLPTLAVSLAQLTVAPDLEIIYESGVCGAHPTHLPETIADSVLITYSEAVLPMTALFGYVLQGGRIDVGFLGAAQIDHWGNLNSSVIATGTPREVPPGSAARWSDGEFLEVLVVMRRHNLRSSSPTDFCTSGRTGRRRTASTAGQRRHLGHHRSGILARSAHEELQLVAVHRGTVEQVEEATGWDLRVAPELATIDPPSPDELRVLRHDVDPERVYLR